MKVSYSVWWNSLARCFEVARTAPDDLKVVQTNIKTREKASEAAKVWQQREEDKGK